MDCCRSAIELGYAAAPNLLGIVGFEFMHEGLLCRRIIGIRN
jgi:hypothetical protein